MIWLIAAAYAETLSTSGISTLLSAVRASTEGSVVLVASSGEDEEIIRDAVKAGLVPSLRLVRGSSLSTTALERSRTNAGVACAIGLTAADDGRWQAIASGACGSAFPRATATALAAPKVASAPVPAPKPKPAAKPRAKPAPVVEVVAELVPEPPPPPPAPPWNVALLETLLGLPDHAARRVALSDTMSAETDPTRTVRVAQTLAVVSQLEVSQRTDPSVIRFFLEAVLSDDDDTRTAALDAARRRGDPPRAVVVIAAAAPTPALAESAPDGIQTTEAFATLPALIVSEPVPVAPAPMLVAFEPAAVVIEPAAVVIEPSPVAILDPGYTSVTAAPPSNQSAVSVPEPVATPAAAPLDPMAALRAYKARHFARGVSANSTSARLTTGNGAHTTWAVYQGGSAVLSTSQFAEAVGDTDLLNRLRDQRTASQLGGGALLVGGTLLGAAGIGMLDNNADPVAPAFLIGAGGLAAASGIGWVVAVPRQQRHVDRYYVVDAADARIEAYNEGLRGALGVDPRDALGIDLQLAGPTLTPWVMVGSAGIAGTF